MHRAWLASLFLAVPLFGCAHHPAPELRPISAAEIDVDGDGIPDSVDQCVTEKEDGLPPFPTDGCKADPNDPDGDGIGLADRCPNQPETMNGYQDEDGCPDELPSELVQVTTDEIKCGARIMFAYNRAKVDVASMPVIEQVAKAMKTHPEIGLVEVAGHADSTGAPMSNVALTKARAGAVIESLVAQGVDPARLRPAGYGSYCPVDAGADKDAREKNRRVEFKVLVTGGQATNVACGCDAAARAGIKSNALASSR